MQAHTGDFLSLIAGGGASMVDGRWLMVNGDGTSRRPSTINHQPLTINALDTHGTTVIAVKYDKGVLNVGDRRATANFAVMFDRAEKVIALDDYTLIAISGSFARSMEIVRFLKHTFKYFSRTYLQEMSLDGKVSE